MKLPDKIGFEDNEHEEDSKTCRSWSDLYLNLKHFSIGNDITVLWSLPRLVPGEMVEWSSEWRSTRQGASIRPQTLISYASKHVQLIASNLVLVYSERMTGRTTTRLYIPLQKIVSFWRPIIPSWSNVSTRRLPKIPKISNSHSQLKCPGLPLARENVPIVPRLEAGALPVSEYAPELSKFTLLLPCLTWFSFLIWIYCLDSSQVNMVLTMG